jgi:hypothetical protein
VHNPLNARRVDFVLDGRVLKRDAKAPFRATLLRRYADDDRRVHTIAARLPRGLTLRVRSRTCRHPETIRD